MYYGDMNIIARCCHLKNLEEIDVSMLYFLYLRNLSDRLKLST